MGAEQSLILIRLIILMCLIKEAKTRLHQVLQWIKRGQSTWLRVNFEVLGCRTHVQFILIFFYWLDEAYCNPLKKLYCNHISLDLLIEKMHSSFFLLASIFRPLLSVEIFTIKFNVSFHICSYSCQSMTHHHWTIHRNWYHYQNLSTDTYSHCGNT